MRFGWTTEKAQHELAQAARLRHLTEENANEFLREILRCKFRCGERPSRIDLFAENVAATIGSEHGIYVRHRDWGWMAGEYIGGEPTLEALLATCAMLTPEEAASLILLCYHHREMTSKQMAEASSPAYEGCIIVDRILYDFEEGKVYQSDGGRTPMQVAPMHPVVQGVLSERAFKRLTRLNGPDDVCWAAFVAGYSGWPFQNNMHGDHRYYAPREIPNPHQDRTWETISDEEIPDRVNFARVQAMKGSGEVWILTKDEVAHLREATGHARLFADEQIRELVIKRIGGPVAEWHEAQEAAKAAHAKIKGR